MNFIIKENGVKIAYELHIKDKRNPYIVVLTHGTCGHKNNLFFPELVRNLNFNSIRFDFQGNGDSEGEFLIGGFDREVEDLKNVVNWCTSQGYKVISIIGHSKAGNTVLLYAGLYSIPLVVTIGAEWICL